MKLDLINKAEKLKKHIPGFLGYSPLHCLETDFLLRRYVLLEAEKVRDRLADFMASRNYSGQLGERFSYVLKTVAYLKDELIPVQDEERKAKCFTSEDEIRLMDADLVLLEKLEGLHTPLDRMETAESPEKVEQYLNIFDEGLAEVDDIFHMRRQVFEEGRAELSSR